MSRKALTAAAAAQRLALLRLDWDAAANAGDEQRCQSINRQVQAAEEAFAWARPVSASEAAIKLRHAAQIADMLDQAAGMPKGCWSFIGTLLDHAASTLALLGDDAAASALELVELAEAAERAGGDAPSRVTTHILSALSYLRPTVRGTKSAAA